MPCAALIRIRDLLSRLHLISTESDLERFLVHLTSLDSPRVLSFVNAHAVNLAYLDEDFARQLKESDWVLRDGIGVKIALKTLGTEPGLNLNGTDLIPRILTHFRGRSLALCGTRTDTLLRAAENIREKYDIATVAHLDGFQADTAYLDLIREARPGIIVLAMGMPKQERVSVLLKRELNHPCLIINGGAIVDFIAGEVVRAPRIFRQCGMEWAWRLAAEPRRLWKRYVIGNVSFLFRVLRLKLP